MALAKFVPYEMKTSLVKVTSYAGKNLAGYLINPYYQQEMYFGNLTQLLFLMDDMLNSLSFPQESMENRIFAEKDRKEKRAVAVKEPPAKAEVLATFQLKVLFRQNASWQGSIIWVEEKSESQFRSVMELIVLMDSVLAKNE